MHASVLNASLQAALLSAAAADPTPATRARTRTREAAARKAA
eukprot:CAMPEP_0172802334 /NCGR_PEP_ID=MMETSP1075-20121228/3841_1 /TAXON_ID=2916 /ORGANISM="Ceratium fusus, Strain PA161109" /LENGTH=41 /DNA_ID= /DNA_START= /DNA_END= /DNA_ORIENTATION=